MSGEVGSGAVGSGVMAVEVGVVGNDDVVG